MKSILESNPLGIRLLNCFLEISSVEEKGPILNFLESVSLNPARYRIGFFLERLFKFI
jgi:hypothetical protein